MREWIDLEPELELGGRGAEVLVDCAEQLALIERPANTGREELKAIRSVYLDRALDAGEEAQVVRVIVSALCDLRTQGWDVTPNGSSVRVRKPARLEDKTEEKERIRTGLRVERDRQLAQPSVRRFVENMEQQRVGPDGWTSIFSLMRNGVTLAEELENFSHLPPDELRRALGRVIKPYIQVVDDSSCRFTGLPLKKIWRYFRHTWSSPHKTTPGRNIWFLIRDAAVEPHPVIGIAALGSSVVQMNVRDDWIGWSRKRLLADLRENASPGWAKWFGQQLDQLIGQVYTADFREDGLLTDDDLTSPDEFIIEALKEVAEEERTKHRRFGSSSDHKRTATSEIDWEERARTSLFAWKRAKTLADLLDARRILRESGLTSPTSQALSEVLSCPRGSQAFARVLRRIKAVRVGHDILDITVCGAVAPYNHLLGGKLVSLLLASPEVSAAYAERYAGSASIIASSMAGRPVCRTPRLVMLGTTSLYGVGSSQYNRLTLPAGDLGGHPNGEIRFEKLGTTEGYGSFHFSDATMHEARTLVAQRDGGRKVRYIFGEGTNPRMREVRGALDEVGLPADDMLCHDTPRIVYAVGLARNLREVLLGKDEMPDYILPQEQPESVTAKIVDFWTDRWLAMRATKDFVLDRLRNHHTTHPREHGARVPLPCPSEDVPASE